MYGAYNYDGILFVPKKFKTHMGLVTTKPESEILEYKGFGKITFGDKSKSYQANELKETIVAFLNTNGGRVLLGVHDKNGFLAGGDYTLEDKDKFGLFLKNFSKTLGISGLGLIKHEFYSIPDEYKIDCHNKEADRCLVIITVYKSNKLILYNRAIFIRELNSNSKISYDSWLQRLEIQKKYSQWT